MKAYWLGWIGLGALLALTGAKGDGCQPAPQQGEVCGVGDACAVGLTCVHYYGIAGPSGPEFRSCEIPCTQGSDCPKDQACTLIADGPGHVCRPSSDAPCDPSVEQSCGANEVCVADTLTDQGFCHLAGHGQSVGAGYACGGSIGNTCAQGLYCKGLAHDVHGGTGVCAQMTCDDWRTEFDNFLASMQGCVTAEDCAAVSGTSCGCTRNVVVNKNGDYEGFVAFVQQMNDAGCGRRTPCDCPAAQGFACVDGICGWNYQ
ncbi:MAG TPA: hypothetical protein PLJ27_06155 [Polyangiaceae bacterium]|nr:MAG: hypothetical protein BWY17_01777 [Deltaproteobacteria bacterium ADurb.Bin207]HNS98509.1 hypothetical protein [Polyangiaceae bacterium]HNZ23945.1 hypothetical protein [Polyangiaceae bacterium]HOD21804.1 hypothetical protein [Polyangiaceae bacterium]HOE49514.1 hypothetical protein [Polyangiaceae bacterium]